MHRWCLYVTASALLLTVMGVVMFMSYVYLRAFFMHSHHISVAIKVFAVVTIIIFYAFLVCGLGGPMVRNCARRLIEECNGSGEDDNTALRAGDAAIAVGELAGPSNPGRSADGLDLVTDISYPKMIYSEFAKLYDGSSKLAGQDISCCSICLGDYKESEVVRVMEECGHVFHSQCIDEWLLLHPTCPLCRRTSNSLSHPPQVLIRPLEIATNWISPSPYG